MMKAWIVIAGLVVSNSNLSWAAEPTTCLEAAKKAASGISNMRASNAGFYSRFNRESTVAQIHAESAYRGYFELNQAIRDRDVCDSRNNVTALQWLFRTIDTPKGSSPYEASAAIRDHLADTSAKTSQWGSLTDSALEMMQQSLQNCF